MPSATSLLLLTSADLGGRSLFRGIRVELSVRPGEGRLWVDIGGSRVDLAWQAALRNLASVGRQHYRLPWDQTDLFVSSRGKQSVLDGRSASLPLFVSWVALLSDKPLPEPFLATGVVNDSSDRLNPAPREYLQGKLDFAHALVQQQHPGRRVSAWVPAGSDFDPGPLSALDVRQVASLPEAVRAILGVEGQVIG